MQQSAVQALRKERGPGDIDKLEDYEAAAEVLLAECRPRDEHLCSTVFDPCCVRWCWHAFVVPLPLKCLSKLLLVSLTRRSTQPPTRSSTCAGCRPPAAGWT